MIARGWELEGLGWWYRGDNSDEQELDLGQWTRSAVYRRCVVELCTWNLYNFFNQWHPKMRGELKIPEFIYKKLCIYSYVFKLQSPSKYSPFDAIHLWTHFYHCSKQFLNSAILMSFSASAVISPLPHQQDFSLCGLFSSRDKEKNVAQGEIGWIGREGHRDCVIVVQKLLNTQHGVGRCTCKSPIMKWANVLKESSKKNFTEAECSLSQQCQLVHWYRWVPRTLT